MTTDQKLAELLVHNLRLAPGITADTPIYRITPLRYLLNDIRQQRLTLTRVWTWPDQHEGAYFKRECLFGPKREPTGLYNLALYCFGMSWSTEADSDAMWHVYGGANDAAALDHGVQIQTTPRRLMAGLVATLGSAHPALLGAMNILFYMGSATYHTKDEFNDLMASPVRGILSDDGWGIATMLLRKPDGFTHEHEIRLLCQSHLVTDGGVPILHRYVDPTITAPVDIGGPGQLVRFMQLPYDWSPVGTLTVGPRVDAAMLAKIAAEVHAVLPGVTVRKSPLYDKPSFAMPPY